MTFNEPKSHFGTIEDRRGNIYPKLSGFEARWFQLWLHRIFARGRCSSSWNIWPLLLKLSILPTHSWLDLRQVAALISDSSALLTFSLRRFLIFPFIHFARQFDFANPWRLPSMVEHFAARSALLNYQRAHFEAWWFLISSSPGCYYNSVTTKPWSQTCFGFRPYLPLQYLAVEHLLGFLLWFMAKLLKIAVFAFAFSQQPLGLQVHFYTSRAPLLMLRRASCPAQPAFWARLFASPMTHHLLIIREGHYPLKPSTFSLEFLEHTKYLEELSRLWDSAFLRQRIPLTFMSKLDLSLGSFSDRFYLYSPRWGTVISNFDFWFGFLVLGP